VDFPPRFGRKGRIEVQVYVGVVVDTCFFTELREQVGRAKLCGKLPNGGEKIGRTPAGFVSAKPSSF
jgi:hypothetical protein